MVDNAGLMYISDVLFKLLFASMFGVYSQHLKRAFNNFKLFRIKGSSITDHILYLGYHAFHKSIFLA